MSRIKTVILTSVIIFFGITTYANAEIIILQSDDLVGITFWLISMSCLAATVFLLLEAGNVEGSWKTPLRVAGLITGVAFVHYMYMRNVWVHEIESPTTYRYIDWFITMPLQIIEFYLILITIRKIPNSIFWNLLITTFIMVLGSYLGEAGYIPILAGFLIWITGWLYILYELFVGATWTFAERITNKATSSAYGLMRMVVVVGWGIYPLCYIFGYLFVIMGPELLNIIYNLADFVNKIAFGLIIWLAAVSNTSPSKR